MTVLWNANEGIVVEHDEKAMERPGLVGPMGETLVMDVDPVSEEIVYRVDYSLASEGGAGIGVKMRRRRSLEAASKIYKRAKEHIGAFIELHRVAMSMRAPRSNITTIDLMDGSRRYHP